ncbi:unnamed protein product [Adineta steineri]|uniref:EGF-like domain-containing protein n=1 Tax=Adineta steineri TaxID=433720 RepID=A0A814MDU6_9BILA|nr:unnamed protein product [Adineta steineri]CAF1078324.1 unnamed protein product [Adineta steineri]
MLIVNVNGKSNHSLLNSTINGLCIGLFYEFSAYLANAVETHQITKRKVRIEARKTTDPKDLLANVTMDLIQRNYSMPWEKHSLSFNASATSVLLSMIALDNGESGSCVAIDDIELRVCPTTYSDSCPTDITTTSTPTTTLSTTTTSSSSSSSLSTLSSTTTTSSSTTTTSTTSSSLSSTTATTSTTSSSSTTTETTSTTRTTTTSTTTSATTTETTSSAATTTSTETPSSSSTTTTTETSSSTTRSSTTTPSTTTIASSSTTSAQKTSPMVTTRSNVNTSSLVFVPIPCTNSTFIGLSCNISNTPCFTGTYCEVDQRICKPHLCLHNGTCNETSNTTVHCVCENGWEGIHCESMVNYCEGVECMNNGVCRPLLLGYKCECLGTSYYGTHCEFTARKVVISKIISKSFSYIAIIALSIVVMFIVIMDILTYCFGIDMTREELERYRREKRDRKRINRRVNKQLIRTNIS